MTEAEYLAAIQTLEKEKSELQNKLLKTNSQIEALSEAETIITGMYLESKGSDKKTNNEIATQAIECAKCSFKEKCVELPIRCRCKIYNYG